MPVPASAGCNVSVTGRPEWTPTPDTVARAPSVVCLPAFMYPSRNPFGDRSAECGTPSSPDSLAVCPCCCAGKPDRPNPALVPSNTPYAEPNTGPNEANSRFLSDCYRRKSLENTGKYEISAMVPWATVTEHRRPERIAIAFQNRIHF